VSGTPPSPEKDSHPNRGTLGQPPMGGGDHLYLSSDQLRDDDRPSWKAPREPGSRWSAQRIIVLAILRLSLGLVIYFKATGVV
jgi:hypothetical protein